MIDLDNVSFSYGDDSEPVLHEISLHITEAELCLVMGPTGCGKSTLLGLLNGLVPHFTGGTLTGTICVAGRSIAQHRPRDLSDVIGVVGQDTAAGFVTDTVEDELAYGMESLGLDPQTMRRRVEETLDLLGLVDLRRRSLATLSSGQQQRVAIGSVLTTHPQVLVLDEPTSALDPPAAEEALAILQRLAHDVGITVVIAEHRLERVVHFADRVIYLQQDRQHMVGVPESVLAHSSIAPPVVELGRALGWDPLAMSVRDARRRVRELALPRDNGGLHRSGAASTEPVIIAEGLTVAYGGIPALRDIDLRVCAGDVVALMGRNGAGKSSLLRAATGLVKPTAGRVTLGGCDPSLLKPAELIQTVGFVPHDPGELLIADTVAEECALADRDARVPDGYCQALLEELIGDIDLASHPRDLSEGQRLALVVAIQLASTPPVLLLDEPTRGLDYPAKRRLTHHLQSLASRGHAIVVATHDVELAAAVATRTVVLADGEIVMDGETASVITSSPAFAPQIAKIFSPLTYLTVEQVTQALDVA